MYHREFSIIDKWMEVNYPNILDNPTIKENKSVSYHSLDGGQFYLIYLMETEELYLTNDFDKFFKNTFGENYLQYLKLWFESKTEHKVKSII